MLINKSKVKSFTLEMANGRHHKFTRVGGDFCIKCEGQLKEFIRNRCAVVMSSKFQGLLDPPERFKILDNIRRVKELC